MTRSGNSSKDTHLVITCLLGYSLDVFSNRNILHESFKCRKHEKETQDFFQ
jgi:hypothetical protein